MGAQDPQGPAVRPAVSPTGVCTRQGWSPPQESHLTHTGATSITSNALGKAQARGWQTELVLQASWINWQQPPKP